MHDIHVQFELTLEKKGQPRMVNPEKLVTLETQDTGRPRQQKQKTKNKNPRNMIRDGLQYRQTHKNKVNKTWDKKLQIKAVNMMTKMKLGCFLLLIRRTIPIQ